MLWPLQGSASKSHMLQCSVEKRGLGELVDFQVSPPPNSTVVQPEEQEIKKRQQEACIDE